MSTHEPAGSGAPALTFLHWPSDPLTAHDLHDPVQAVAQQTPWAQIPDAHWELAEQAAPVGSLPQELLVQKLPAEQFASLVHAVKQREPLHTKGAHGVAAGATHCRAPSHVEAPVWAPLAHRSAAQTVPAGYV